MVNYFLFPCLGQTSSEDGDDVVVRSKVRLIVPNSSCGGIIGKGGSTIKYELFTIFVAFEGFNCVGIFAFQARQLPI